MTPSVRLACLVLASVSMACGKKGPPLPPLVRLPAAPAEMTAARRGSQVEVHFLAPSANLDGSRPAEIERVDVYAASGRDIERWSDDQWLARGERIASLPVRTPPPEDADEADEAGGAGRGEPGAVGRTRKAGASQGPDSRLDQGARATVSERVDGVAAQAREYEEPVWVPLVGRFAAPMVAPAARRSRVYAAVGVTRRGRRGPLSSRASISLAPPPGSPGSLEISYSETALTVRWAGVDPLPRAAVDEPDGSLLPSRRLVASASTTGYHVYESPRDGTERRLTSTPSTDTAFVDTRLTWGAERCYIVRAAVVDEGRLTEGEPSARRCVTLTDTFAPASPQGLTAIPGEGAVSLIWQPNQESDLAGYLVLRDVGETGTFTPVTAEPVRQATFRDVVPAGVRTAYAVQAVDSAGNASAPSSPVQETAR